MSGVWWVRNVPKLFKELPLIFERPIADNKVAANKLTYTQIYKYTYWRYLFNVFGPFFGLNRSLFDVDVVLSAYDSYHIVMLFYGNDTAISAIFCKTTNVNSSSTPRRNLMKLKHEIRRNVGCRHLLYTNGIENDGEKNHHHTFGSNDKATKMLILFLVDCLNSSKISHSVKYSEWIFYSDALLCDQCSSHSYFACCTKRFIFLLFHRCVSDVFVCVFFLRFVLFFCSVLFCWLNSYSSLVCWCFLCCRIKIQPKLSQPSRCARISSESFYT